MPLPLLSGGPSGDGFQLTLSVSKFSKYVFRYADSRHFCFPFFGAPSLGALGSCRSRLPLDPPLETMQTAWRNSLKPLEALVANFGGGDGHLGLWL